MAADLDAARATPLTGMLAELGGKMVSYADHALPVQFAGVMAEHTHTRTAASLFDVSHMGQVTVRGPGAAEALEALIPANLIGLAEGRQRYGLLTNSAGGIEDDLMAARLGPDNFVLVVNGACRDADFALLKAGLPGLEVSMAEDRALIALQGPKAEAALSALWPEAAEMRFMDVREAVVDGISVLVARAGYTGEDGYEISVSAQDATRLAKLLLAQQDVLPAGLGARDSLRLEAGLPLMGNDMGPDVSPAQAGLGWGIPKIRRTGGARAGGFPGADAILAEFENGAARSRVGLRPVGRAPMRAGIVLFADQEGGTPVGEIQSGGFGPTVGGPIAMGRVDAARAQPGTTLYGEMRGKRLPVEVAPLPFTPAQYKR